VKIASLRFTVTPSPDATTGQEYDDDEERVVDLVEVDGHRYLTYEGGPLRTEVQIENATITVEDK
jgi:hypothetical protein